MWNVIWNCWNYNFYNTLKYDKNKVCNKNRGQLLKKKKIKGKSYRNTVNCEYVFLWTKIGLYKLFMLKDNVQFNLFALVKNTVSSHRTHIVFKRLLRRFVIFQNNLYAPHFLMYITRKYNIYRMHFVHYIVVGTTTIYGRLK